MNDVVHQNTVCLLISGMKNNDGPACLKSVRLTFVLL